MKISLNKALKLKNKKASNLSMLASRIQSNNTSIEGNKPTYDVRDLITKHAAEAESMIVLKTAINKANVGINEKIITLSELKSKISVLNGMPANEGISQERQYGIPGKVEVKTVAVISQKEKDEMIASLQEQIENLQEEIDQFNATTFIEI